MEMMPGFSTDSARSLLADTLRMFVGLGKRLSWADLASATGDNERKLRSYVEADGPVMPFDVFMRIFAVLPPDAFARVARHMGFSAAPAEVDDEATVRRVLAQSSRLVADGNEFLEDGRISPSERAQLADRAAALLPAMQSLAGAKTSH
jgi:hypothetical protein